MLGHIIPGLVFHRDKMRAAAPEGHATATDFAVYLVRRGVAFRDAHAAVGRAVAAAETNQTDLADLPLATLQSFCPAVDDDVFEVLTLDGSVQSRDHIGGTAPVQVRYQIQTARARLKQH